MGIVTVFDQSVVWSWMESVAQVCWGIAVAMPANAKKSVVALMLERLLLIETLLKL
ncbi:MAG: HD-like signal output (HDOD) protein [Planctomycetota bacterium]